VSNITVPVGWFKGESNLVYKTVRWSAESTNYFLDPNEEIDSLSFKSQGLPIISNSYSYGYFPTPTFAEGEGPEQVTNNDIYENAVIKKTIAPKTIPNPFDPLAFIDDMIDMGDEADTLGWIGKPEQDYQVWNILKGKLNKVHSYIENENYNHANEELNSFLTAVEDYYKGKTKNLTNEGYALMKYNGEYLIKHIRTLGK
jgi:hypothetical protein